jgi:hypothetical protein
MEYMSERKLVEHEDSQGYWVKGSKIYNVTDNQHIEFIESNPELFNVTSEYIENLMLKVGEDKDSFNKTREFLVGLVSQDGWIRVRHYNNPMRFWVIGCDNTKMRKTDIKEFCYWAIKNNLMGYHDKATILGYSKEDDLESYAGVDKFLMEEKRKKSIPI